MGVGEKVACWLSVGRGEVLVGELDLSLDWIEWECMGYDGDS